MNDCIECELSFGFSIVASRTEYMSPFCPDVAIAHASWYEPRALPKQDREVASGLNQIKQNEDKSNGTERTNEGRKEQTGYEETGQEG